MPASRTNRILLTAAAALGVAAGAAGITGAVTTGAGTTEPAVPRSEAEAAALVEVPGTVTEVELDDDGTGTWDVEVVDPDGRAHDVVVDATTGAVVASAPDDERDERDDRDDAAPIDAAEAAVAQDRAEATALGAAPGTVRQIHLEHEDGRLVWDVEVDGSDGRRHDIQVDATSGTIVEHDLDD